MKTDATITLTLDQPIQIPTPFGGLESITIRQLIVARTEEEQSGQQARADKNALAHAIAEIANLIEPSELGPMPEGAALDIIREAVASRYPTPHPRRSSNHKTKMKTDTNQAYLKAYARAMEAIKNLENRIHDMPAPDGEIEIHWGHVGDMNRIADALNEVAPNGI